jgi:hypothetical protein
MRPVRTDCGKGLSGKAEKDAARGNFPKPDFKAASREGQHDIWFCK